MHYIQCKQSYTSNASHGEKCLSLIVCIHLQGIWGLVFRTKCTSEYLMSCRSFYTIKPRHMFVSVTSNISYPKGSCLLVRLPDKWLTKLMAVCWLQLQRHHGLEIPERFFKKKFENTLPYSLKATQRDSLECLIHPGQNEKLGL